MRAEKAEIIAVGTELLLGQIANTNAQWISKELAALGLPVYSHTVVGDNMDRVRTCFKAAGARSDIIIVTGGLGPTEDDLTRDAAQEIFGQELVEHEPSMVKILAVFERNGRPMTLNNRKQSHVFQQAEVLTNSKGMAPGQIVEHEGTIWVFLPGVPSEMKALMEEEVLPKLRERFEWKSQIVSEMMRFIGIGESRLETELSDLISTQTNPTIAPLASEGEVGLRLTATGETDAEALQSIEALKGKILERVGGHYYGSDAVTIEEKVKQLLESRNYTIGSAESFTGGMFMENLVALPGASAVCEGGIVSYTPAAKEQVLQVPSFIIKEFGTISHECAEVMALNAQAILRTDIGISFTGVAGPEESEGKAPGTVYIGLQIGERKPEVHELYFHGAREQVRHRAVKKGFELLFQRLK